MKLNTALNFNLRLTTFNLVSFFPLNAAKTCQFVLSHVNTAKGILCSPVPNWMDKNLKDYVSYWQKSDRFYT